MRDEVDNDLKKYKNLLLRVLLSNRPKYFVHYIKQNTKFRSRSPREFIKSPLSNYFFCCDTLTRNRHDVYNNV